MKLGLNAQMWVVAGEHDVSLNTEIQPDGPSDDSNNAISGVEEFDGVSDVTLSDSMTEADASTRRLGGIKGYEPAMRDLGLEIPNYKRRDTDAAFGIIKTAYLARTPITVWVLDGPQNKTESTGIAMVCKVFSKNQEQPLDDIVNDTLTIKPCDSQYAPVAITGLTPTP